METHKQAGEVALTSTSDFPYKEDVGGSIPSAPTQYLTLRATYPVVFGKIALDLGAAGERQDYDPRDGIPFARKALAEAEAQVERDGARRKRALRDWALSSDWSVELKTVLTDVAEQQRRFTSERDRLRAGGLARRPKRWMPSLIKVAAYHRLPEPPACYRCLEETDAPTWRTANGELQRAHIIDRVFDGLDSVANLLPLCPPCHRSQPIFKNGDEAKAMAWFLELHPSTQQ